MPKRDAAEMEYLLQVCKSLQKKGKLFLLLGENYHTSWLTPQRVLFHAGAHGHSSTAPSGGSMTHAEINRKF